MRNQEQNIIAVPEAEQDCTGAIVWWTLSGTVSSEELIAELEIIGFDDVSMLQSPSPATALQRAVKEQQGLNRLVRRLPNGTWAIVDETLPYDTQAGQRLDPSYAVVCKASIDKVGRIEVEPADHSLMPDLVAAYCRHLTELSATDLSNWLVQQAKSHSAVPLRESGGIYFIPRGRVDSWTTIMSCLMRVGASIVYNIPAMSGEDAALAIVDALSRDVNTQVFALNRGEPGKRALKNRLHHCDELQEKVARYEKLLGKSLDSLNTSLGDLQAGLSMALLKAEAS